MIAASFLGIFVIPPLYVLFQGLRERAWSLMRRKGAKQQVEPSVEGASGAPKHLPAE